MPKDSTDTDIQNAIRRLEARLTAFASSQSSILGPPGSLATPVSDQSNLGHKDSNGLGLQGALSLPASKQFIVKYEDDFTEIMRAATIAKEGGYRYDQTNLHFLLDKLTHLLLVFAHPVESVWSSIGPETYTLYSNGPKAICYSLTLENIIRPWLPSCSVFST
jgi:hypothetical protein